MSISLQKPSADTESVGNSHPLINLKPPHPHLFALIIGISEYQSHNITNLLGPVADADAVQDFLLKQLGVPSSQIRNLRDSEATRAAIINEILVFSLNDKIKVGDPILIYYAGHGGSAKKPKNWEGGTDTIELLIPYDYHSQLLDGNHKHGIPDRTLEALLWKLAENKGDNITVILDCNHFVSGTRYSRDPTELVRGIDAGNILEDLDLDVRIESSKERGAVIDASFHHGGPRSHVLLAACGPEESAYERRGRGLFTQRLLEVLSTFEIDKLTYVGLLQRMPRIPGQNPQCSGVNQNRVIFNAKATKKSAIYYIIREKGAGYVMPGVGSARGISLGAEFEVYQDPDSQLLGILVASEIKPFSTTLYSKEPELKLVLKGDGVARQTSAGTDSEEHILRIYVADEKLKALVKRIERTDSIHRIIQPVEKYQAEFGMAVEDEKVVFDIFDPLVTKYGLTRMSYSLEISDDLDPDSDAIMITRLTPVLRAADHFYWHLRRTPGVESDTERGLADFVEIAVAEMEHDGISYNDYLEPLLYPTKAGWESGKEFGLQVEERGTIHGWKIINKSGVALYPTLFYFDNSDWSITSYYHPPSSTAQGTVNTSLKRHRYRPVDYGDTGADPYTFFFRKDQNVNVGILKLFLSREHVDLSDVTQSTPFEPIGRYTRQAKHVDLSDFTPSEPIGCYTRPATVETTKLRFLWDTILVPVVQRLHGALAQAESADKREAR